MKIVFVCTGNLCRSALAETILKKMLDDRDIDGMEVASCGTISLGDMERDETMCRIASEHGYDMGGKAIAINEKLLNPADLILVMADRHREEVTKILKYDHWNKIRLFSEYCFGTYTDVPDPHYQTEYLYRRCFDAIEKGCTVIAEALTKNIKDKVDYSSMKTSDEVKAVYTTHVLDLYKQL